ncbi:MAG TPA: SBBP repeat-containing protein, partial [Chloroflexia bacterium]|nr:SBBP repeat-containing protein [Chloroflexia bacterium]
MPASLYMGARKSAPLMAVGVIALIVALLLGMGANPGQIPAQAGPAGLPAAPVQFEPNVGQANEAVSYVARMPGGTLYFGKSTLLIEAKNRSAQGQPAAVRMELLGANDSPAIEAGAQLPGKVNYLIGADRSRWRTGVPTYGAVTYRSLYDGIDLEYVGQPGQVEGIYTLAPGADAAAIRWRYEGAREVTVDVQGNLQVMAGSSDNTVAVTEHTPFAWQTIEGKQVPVSVRYEVAADNTIAFALGAYDRAQSLTIDPVLTFSTYLGGNQADEGTGIAVDGAGNVYVAGTTGSTNFPVVGGFQTANQGGQDAFVTKFNPAGGVVYSTYLGGGGNDTGHAVAVDASGSAYVTGLTGSSNFPTLNAYQPTRPGGTDAFITKLAPDGASLIYSSYFGGSVYDDSSGIATDGANGAYIVGRTSSTNLPTRNAYQATYGGVYDGYLARFNTAASGDASLVYATYLGGSGQEWVGTTGYGQGDWGHGVAADSQGNAYFTGNTYSANFPVRGAYQGTLSGLGDAFVSKINTGLVGDASLVYSTFLGGSAIDSGKDVEVDAAGSAYVVGATGSTNFPTLNRYAPCTNGPCVTKLNPAGNALVYSTCFGPSGRGWGADIALDAEGNAYVAGTTSEAAFPMVDPIQGTIGGGADAFVLKLSAAGNSLLFSTFLGGTQPEQGKGIARGGTDKIYVTGDTRSTNFPTHNPYQAQCQSCPTTSDAFVTSIQES